MNAEQIPMFGLIRKLGTLVPDESASSTTQSCSTTNQSQAPGKTKTDSDQKSDVTKQDLSYQNYFGDSY